MEIRELDKRIYKDYPVKIVYDTDSYYDLLLIDECIKIEKKPLGYNYHHEKDDISERLYQDWLEGARAFGAFVDDELVGIIEIGTDYSKRMIINLLKVDDDYQRRGIAKALMDKVKAIMYQDDIRAIILETQSCNTKAIGFYQSQGFKLIGFDTICYTNNDLERKEVRLDFGFINDKYIEK